jgi:L-Lysine epsilon oxidase N-terminal/von Willebrand factor type A domain
MSFKIHPGLGLGRAGDSPTDWFIAPETSDPPLVPAGGYRDGELRLKRQGARFRVFEYTGAGEPVECTAPNFQIEWHVTLRKGGVAAPPTVVDTPNQTKDVPPIPFTSPSQVSLGQLRTDGAGRLIVLSGVVAGTDFDARCEGRVTARVRRDGELVFEGALASWVFLTAPDFLPQVRDTITAYDQLMQAWQTHVGFAPAELAAAPSLRADIYPLFRHGVPLTVEPTPPPIAPVTPGTQYRTRLLQHWANDNVIHDLPSMIGEPPRLPLTPKELDRGPLTHAAGSGFWDVKFPGQFSHYSPTLLFSEPLRFDPTLSETALEGKLLSSVNWCSDYLACSGEWPTQVPSILSGDPFEGDWRAQGFIVLQGDQLVYQESAVSAYIVQLTHSIDFGVVNPAIGGPGRQAAAIEMEVGNLGAAPLSIDLVLPLPAQVVAVTASVSVSSVPIGESRTLRLWVAYETGADIAPGAVVQFTDSNGGSYSIPVMGQTGAPTTSAIALVLDLSTSMTDDRGDGFSKLEGLKEAVEMLLTLADDLSGVGVAPFSSNALSTQAVLKLGEVQPSSLTGRQTIHNFVDALSVVSATSIGDGLVSGRAVLSGATGYDRHVLLVVTDGLENQPVWIRDVAATIDDLTYAVGIGNGSNVNVGTLQTLTGNTGGYLLLTGATIAGDNALLLEKHFVQILSGVQHEQLLVDPLKFARPGVVERIPFAVTEGDSSFTALVVSDRASELQLALLTPEGDVLSPAVVQALPQGRFVDGRRVRAFKVQLPLRTDATTSHFAGQWWLLVSAGPLEKDGSAQLRAAVRPSGKPPIAFRAAVSCYSALELDASIQQSGVVLGSELLVDASLRWYGVPFDARAQVFAELNGPEGNLELPLQRVSPGRYVAKYQPRRLGDYDVRLRARGLSPRQYPFVREFSGTLSIKRQELEGIPPESGGRPSAPRAGECARLLRRCLAEYCCKLGERLKDRC